MSNSAPEISVIVPTLNEAQNIPLLVEKLNAAFANVNWEVIFVDDNSADGTIDAVHAIAQQDSRVRGIRRIGRHGLSSACIEGILSSSAPYVAVMDADLQHDEYLLPKMFEALHQNNYELVVASRYLQDDSMENWSNSRKLMSRVATSIGKLATRVNLTDPMSGFFAMRRTLFNEHAAQLSGIGFKILFDICASFNRSVRFCELPYSFGTRIHGESKMSTQVAWDYLLTIGHKFFGRLLPVKFLSFSLVGAVGTVIHMGVLYIAFEQFKAEFVTAQTIAAVTAMSLNFWMNNNLTFKDTAIKRSQMIRGIVSFFIACGIGALISISLATYLYNDYMTPWYLAAMAGIIVAAVWNYATNSFYTWRQ